MAKCANGHFFAHGDFYFSGISLHGSVVKHCRSKR